jgi:hypothetical protein
MTEVRGGPPLHIPKIGTRIGLDLHRVNVRSAEERQWLLALSFPEFREQQARLAIALDVVAQTDIRTLEGDGLALMPRVLAETPSPLCVFHSTCLFYWSAEAKAALDALLIDASRSRDIYRVGIEPSERFDSWYAGRADSPEQPQGIAQSSWGEVVIFSPHVRGRIVDFGLIERATQALAAEDEDFALHHGDSRTAASSRHGLGRRPRIMVASLGQRSEFAPPVCRGVVDAMRADAFRIATPHSVNFSIERRERHRTERRRQLSWLLPRVCRRRWGSSAMSAVVCG